MKKYLPLLFLMFVLFACSNKEKSNNKSDFSQKIDLLQEENEYLKQVNEAKDSAINIFMVSLNDISQNIDIIKQKEDIISLNSLQESMDANLVEQISNDILFINKLMDENKQTIEMLNQQLSNSIIYSEELQKIIDNFLSIINTQEEQLSVYHIEFQALHQDIDSLNNWANSVQQEMLVQKAELNTAYYLSGTSEELRTNNVIRKNGGILSIGSVEVLLEDFNKNAFSKIDIYDLKKIQLNCSKAELLSKHPSYSYKFDGPPNYTYNLVITRPKEFWSTSKYLVILKK